MGSFNDVVGEPERAGAIPFETPMFTAADIKFLLEHMLQACDVMPTAELKMVDKCVLMSSKQESPEHYAKGHVYKCVAAFTETEDVTPSSDKVYFTSQDVSSAVTNLTEFESGVTYYEATYSWQDINVGNVALGNCTDIKLFKTSGSANISLKWRGPANVVVGGVVLATLNKVVLVRNPDHEPTSIEDGTIVTTATSRDQYLTSAYIDTVPDASVTYWYKLFPVSDEGVVTIDSANALQSSEMTWASIIELIRAGEVKDYVPVGSVLVLPKHYVPGTGGSNLGYGDLQAKVVGYVGAEGHADSAKLTRKFALTQDITPDSEKTYYTGSDGTGEVQGSSLVEFASGTDYYEEVTPKYALVVQTEFLLTGSKQFDAAEPYGKVTEDTTYQSGKKYGKFTAATGTDISGKAYFTKSGNTYAHNRNGNGSTDITGLNLYTVEIPTVTVGDAIPSGEEWCEINANTDVKNGNNRYDRSGVRQYLNKTGIAGEWWEAKSFFDVAPSMANAPAFLEGWKEHEYNGTTFNEDDWFLSCLADVDVVSQLASAHGGGSVILSDKVWLPSMWEMSVTGESVSNDLEKVIYDSKQGQNVAAPKLEFWSLQTVVSARIGLYPTSTSGQYYWTRSSNTGDSYTVWSVGTSGSFFNFNAHYSRGLRPCLAIA